MTFGYRHRKQIIIISIVFILIIGITSTIIYYHPQKKKEKKEEPIQLEKKKETKEAIELIKVDIKGQVSFPGIYSLPKSSRVIDVIEKAGGLTEFADTSVINLSKMIQDEMVIIVYSREEVAQFKETKEIEKQVEEKCKQKEENALQNDACVEFYTTNSSNKISINTASLEELTTLSGIGESKARDIINYREANGPFQTIEDLMKVPGIGESTFAKIKESITTE